MSTAGQFWVYLPGYVLAVPASVIATQQWRRARRAEKEHESQQQRQERQQEITDMVSAALKVLTGTDNPREIRPTTAENPSIQESLLQALEETATLTSEVAFIHRALELHLAEPHGGNVPEWMMRAISAQQRAVEEHR